MEKEEEKRGGKGKINSLESKVHFKSLLHIAVWVE